MDTKNNTKNTRYLYRCTRLRLWRLPSSQTRDALLSMAVHQFEVSSLWVGLCWSDETPNSQVHNRWSQHILSQEKCPLSPKKCPFSPLLSALLKTAPCPSDLPAPLGSFQLRLHWLFVSELILCSEIVSFVCEQPQCGYTNRHDTAKLVCAPCAIYFNVTWPRFDSLIGVQPNQPFVLSES